MLLISEVADEDPIGFLVLTPEGMADNSNHWGSWNVSRTNGPLGPICDTDRSKYDKSQFYYMIAVNFVIFFII